MNENYENYEENVEDTEESLQNEQVPVKENIVENGESDEFVELSENDESKTSDSLYDKLVEDIVEKIKGDVSFNLSEQGEEDDLENSGEVEVLDSDIFDVSETYSSDTVSGGIDELIEYLKSWEIETSLNVPFKDATIEELTVTDGLLLIIIVLFMFKWLYEFGKEILL